MCRTTLPDGSVILQHRHDTPVEVSVVVQAYVLIQTEVGKAADVAKAIGE